MLAPLPEESPKRQISTPTSCAYLPTTTFTSPTPREPLPSLLSPTSPLAPLLHAVLPPASALLTGLGHQVGDDVVHSQWVGEEYGHG